MVRGFSAVQFTLSGNCDRPQACANPDRGRARVGWRDEYLAGAHLASWEELVPGGMAFVQFKYETSSFGSAESSRQPLRVLCIDQAVRLQWSAHFHAPGDGGRLDRQSVECDRRSAGPG